MTNKLQTSCAERRAHDCTDLACIPGQTALPVWRASVRMALVSAAGVVAAGLIATGIGGCADMSSIAPQANLRDAASLGLGMAATQAPVPSNGGAVLATKRSMAWSPRRSKAVRI